jgi:DNA-binding transcriptional ArsR family regulator
MDSPYEKSGRILEITLSSKRPVKDLIEMASQFMESRDMDGLYDIDVALTGLLIDYIRKGTGDLFEAFTDDMSAFLDSSDGDHLKSTREGERYFHRWEHLVDFSRIAFEKYDPDMIARFIASRKHGKNLLQVVYKNTDGIRVKDLAEQLDMSAPQLSKLLRELEDHDLVIREKGKKMTLVHLDFLGRVYISGTEESRASGIMESTEIKPLHRKRWDANPFPDDYHDFPLKRGLKE